ncbi:ankyrin repeat-containing domain protein [Fomitopsis serialis]|uniref:ankyrin repeat-containing domain protein n=2 Tax=Fomitopsis serialis TaxID=139415 RepID=UPI002007541C|nr:ankyrin repeat-containing domain protein [Neoantrodia serialis]KAH9917003.1 ankyrin repeat-containing domain protein [Neoantrodia serialis]
MSLAMGVLSQTGLLRSLVSQDPTLVNSPDVVKAHGAARVASAGHEEVIGKLLISRGADINARDKANQLPLHRAATTGSTGFISLLLKPPEESPKPRLNTADRVGNTPLHLAMESAYAEAACLLIEAGADRTRENLDGEMPEDLEGVGGQEQRRAKDYVIERCGKRS